MRAFLAALTVAYPIVAHLAVARRSAPLTLVAAGLLLAVATLPGIRSGRPAAIGAAIVGAGILALLGMQSHATLVLFLPPVVINAFLAWLFGHTLVGDRVPLILRFIRIVHGDEMPYPTMPAYARRLTALWAILFAALALLNAILAYAAVPDGIAATLGLASPLSVSLETWSWCANVFNYLVVGAFFAIEYAIRRRVYPVQPYAHFGDFIRRVALAGPRLWRELRA